MFALTLDDSAKINVTSRQHQFNFAVDGSAPNPLEATFAAIVACAGVYARKACLSLKCSPAGIKINTRLAVRPDNPMMPSKITTDITFPTTFSEDQRKAVMASVLDCPVKSLISHGAEVDFVFNVKEPA